MLFPLVLHIAACAAQFLLSLFFLFVGGMKMFAPDTDAATSPCLAGRLASADRAFRRYQRGVCAAILMLGLFIPALAWWVSVAS